MSEMWTGGMLTGLVLRGDDAVSFVNRYTAKHPDEYADYSEGRQYAFLVENVGMEEVGREYLDCGHYTGLRFYPAHPEEGDSEEVDMVEENPVVIVYAKYSAYSRGFFKGEFYKNYQELEEEFRKTIGEYLPDDFNYKKSIGDLEYGYYG